MIDFSNPKQAEESLNEWVDAYDTTLGTLTLRIATDRCMVEGCQWLSIRRPFQMDARLNRRYTSWEPESQNLVATVNRMMPLIRECKAATQPGTLEVDVGPPDRDTGIEAAERANVLESIINAGIGECGYYGAADDANFRRCVDGDHGIGLLIKLQKRQMQGKRGAYEEEDRVLQAFAFDAGDLILDPANRCRDLRDHEYVVHHRVWSVEAINRYYPDIKLDPQDCKTIGELRSMQMYMNQLSNGRLYADLPKYSKTKGAFVYQIHRKDDANSFSNMLVGVKVPPQNGETMKWANFDDQDSPFGGKSRLPFTMLCAAPRTDSGWSMSDAYLMKDDQDRLNLLQTFIFRMLQKSAGAKWIIAEESAKDIDSFREQFNNAVFGPLFYKSGSYDKPIPPPQLVTQPTPPPFISELVNVYEDQQRRQVHREEITSGGYKTHTTNQTYQTARESANQVLNDRVQDDIRCHNAVLETMLGTFVKLAQEQSPSALAFMRRKGFDESDFAMVASTDWRYPACELSLRESSIRNQSPEIKEARLWKGVELQIITPQKARNALAELGTPFDNSDRQAKSEATKAAMRILLGEEWPGSLLGEYADTFLNEFRRAKWDRRAERDPEAAARLDRAIQTRLLFNQQEMAVTQPPQPEAPTEGVPSGEEAMPQEVNIADLITSISGGGGSQQALPVPA